MLISWGLNPNGTVLWGFDVMNYLHTNMWGRAKVGFETCDAGPKPGCFANCSAPSPDWNCSRASPDICLEICNDGLLVGVEKCNSGPKNECSKDCRVILPDLFCTGGGVSSPSDC